MRFLAPLVQLTSLVAVIAFAGAQNATRSKLAVRSKPQLQNCPATLSMTYIDTVKEITESTLNDFGTSMPILEPLTMPLAFGLTSALPQADQKTSVKALSPTVIRNGLGMKLLANAITSMVDQWASVKARLEAIQKTASEIITTINEITTATMTNLGAQYPELKPITEPLVMALSFSSNNGRGNSVFNWDLEPATVGLNLRLFSGNVTQMADKWEATTNRYLAQEKECRGNDINETADSRADVTTPSSMLNCVASLTTRRQYITTVNQITQSTLSSFARARPVFVMLTTPLTTGLAVNSFVAMAENASIAKIGDPITTTGMGMRLLSKALTTMVNKWEDAQFKFREIENADCVWDWITGKNNCAASIANRRIFIDSINEITRSTLTDLGQQHPRLQRITNPLRVTISFNPISMTGSGLFNFNLPITKTGEHLKAFAQTLDDMVKQWEQTKMKFLQQEQNECRSTNRVETTTTTTPPSTTTVKQSSSSSPLTTTSPTITRITTTTAAAPPLTPDAVTVKTPTNCSQSVATRQNTITTLNGYTRKKMTDFGTQVPRLRPLITSLWIGLNFNPFTQKGAALFNYNEDVSTVAANLQLLAKEIDKMAAEWQQMVRVTCPEPPVTTRGNVTARTGALPAVQNVTESALPRPATVKG